MRRKSVTCGTAQDVAGLKDRWYSKSNTMLKTAVKLSVLHMSERSGVGTSTRLQVELY